MEPYILQHISQYAGSNISNFVATCKSLSYSGQCLISEISKNLYTKYPESSILEIIISQLQSEDVSILLEIRDVPFPNPINWYMFLDMKPSYQFCNSVDIDYIPDIKMAERFTGIDYGLFLYQCQKLTDCFKQHNLQGIKQYLELQDHKPPLSTPFYIYLSKFLDEDMLSEEQLYILWILHQNSYVSHKNLDSIQYDLGFVGPTFDKKWEYSSIMYYDSVNLWKQYKFIILDKLQHFFYLPSQSLIMNEIIQDQSYCNNLLDLCDRLLSTSDMKFQGRVQRLLASQISMRILYS